MRDFLPEDLAKRRFVETQVRECFKFYGYKEVETPIIESFELISAKAGDEIRHRMYTFEDLSGRRLALRPEITPSIARVVSNKYRTATKPLRLGYIANCFRYDNPQMGRYREFWQAGFELFGSTQSTADAEILIVNHDLMKRAGFNNFYFKIGQVAILRAILTAEDITEDQQNTIMGFMDRGKQREVFSLLRKFNASKRCQELIQNLNKLKGTDSQEILAQGKQHLHDYSDAALTALHNLEEIINYAQAGGVETKFFIDLSFARGIEYYTGMIFEVYVNGFDIALGGGGRYDRLVEIFGGGSIPGVGCAPGIDRIALALEKLDLYPKEFPLPKKILVIPVDPRDSLLTAKALEIATILRENGIIAHNEVVGRNMRSALSYANKQDYSHLAIIGQKELNKKCVIIRDLQAKKQWEIPLSELSHALSRKQK